MRNWIAFSLILVSFVLLIPGLYLDLVTITASLSMFGSTTELFRQTRSILQSIQSLHDSGNDLVAGLILLFSVVVPFVKGLLLIAVLAIRAPRARYRIYLFVRSISKWAMADVFVAGVFVAFLAAKAADALDARIEVGFYYFTAYCVVSLLALQFMTVPAPEGVTKTRETG